MQKILIISLTDQSCLADRRDMSDVKKVIIQNLSDSVILTGLNFSVL